MISKFELGLEFDDSPRVILSDTINFSLHKVQFSPEGLECRNNTVKTSTVNVKNQADEIKLRHSLSELGVGPDRTTPSIRLDGDLV